MLFTQLDLASGYLQTLLTAEATEKTAFITEETTGQFTRMPFGFNRCSGGIYKTDAGRVRTITWEDSEKLP